MEVNLSDFFLHLDKEEDEISKLVKEQFPCVIDTYMDLKYDALIVIISGHTTLDECINLHLFLHERCDDFAVTYNESI